MAQVETPIGHSMMGKRLNGQHMLVAMDTQVYFSWFSNRIPTRFTGADPIHGHVAFVEAVNADGSLHL